MKGTWGIIVGAGTGSRFGGKIHKPYVQVGGKPMLWYSLRTFLGHSSVGGVVLVVHRADLSKAKAVTRMFKTNSVVVVPGGARRQDSVQAGIQALPLGVEWVAIHDAARPLLTPKLLNAVLAGAKSGGSAILALPVPDTAKRQNGHGNILKTVPRQGLWLAQTPQVFRVAQLKAAFQQVGRRDVTDDAMLMERMKKPVKLVQGSPWNIKVTTKADLPIVEGLLKRGQK